MYYEKSTLAHEIEAAAKAGKSPEQIADLLQAKGYPYSFLVEEIYHVNRSLGQPRDLRSRRP